MTNKFAEMSLEGFCDYVSCNPGGARKAFELRKRAGGDCGGGKERVVYKDVVKEVRVPVERVVEKEVIREVEVPVDRVVEKEVMVQGKEKDMGWVKYPCIALVLLGGMGMMFGGGSGEVIVKEVPIQVPVITEVEVVREVEVRDEKIVERVRNQGRYIKELEKKLWRANEWINTQTDAVGVFF